MGIHNLSKLLKAEASDAIVEYDVKKLKDKIIAIDVSQTIYQYVLAIRNSGDDLKDKDGNITSHLHALLYKTITIMKNGSKPVYVFDGKPNKLKNELIAKRKKGREEASKIVDNEKDIDKKNKAFRKTFSITEIMVSECHAFLDLLGIPYIKSPEEADPQCAYMLKKKIVDYVQSDDFDLLTFGSTQLLRTIKQSSKTVTKYNRQDILDELNISGDQFIDLCILLGSDYCTTIKGIGPTKALSLIKKHKDIDSIIDWIDEEEPKGFEISDLFREKYAKAQKYFKNPKILKEDEIDLEWNEPNTLKIFKYLEKRNFNPELLKKRISDLWKHWCICEYKNVEKRQSKLKKDLFPGIKFKNELSKPCKINYKCNYKNDDSSDDEIEITFFKRKFK